MSAIRLRSFVFAALALLAGASTALAAEDQAGDKGLSILTWLILLSPVLLGVCFVMLARKSGALKQGGYMEKANEHIDIANEHMKTLEIKTDRMIQLLDSIDRKLSGGD